MNIDPISGIEVATQSARQLKEQRRQAAWAMLRYVIEAINDGGPLDQIINATGFEYQPSMYDALSIFSDGPKTRTSAFASWIGDEVKIAILAYAAEQNDPAR